jgi:hypothetical protein
MGRLEKRTVTKHQRGFFGRVWQIFFWLFQLSMIGLIVANFQAVEHVSAECLEAACEAGAVLGGGLIAVGGSFVWFLGTVILGILMFATRGKLVTYQVL